MRCRVCYREREREDLMGYGVGFLLFHEDIIFFICFVVSLCFFIKNCFLKFLFKNIKLIFFK